MQDQFKTVYTGDSFTPKYQIEFSIANLNHKERGKERETDERKGGEGETKWDT